MNTESPFSSQLYDDEIGRLVKIAASVSLTAFGDTEDAGAFFTGKSMVEGLGYAFLLRNYRPDHGKWLTQDPLGYPDGWNNLVYCGNKCLVCFDLSGGSFWHWLGEQALAGAYGMIYFFNWGSNSTTSICPSNCDPVLQWLSASTIRTSEAVVPRVNNVFSSSLEQFSANNAPGTYIFEVEGMGTTQINVGSSHTWGAIVGTGTFGIITASANIYDGSAKMD